MRVLLGCIASVAFLAFAGCSEDPAAKTAAGGAFTVESGDRFVVSATPEKIVLKKSVDDVDFPFNEASLRGKAILIHPVIGRIQDGVYARAIDVHSENGTYVIDGKPLTLAEMQKIAEPDVVRIYIDLKQSSKSGDGPTLVAQSWPALGQQLHPTALGIAGVGLNGFNMGGFDFNSPFFVMPGITFNHTIETASLTPEVLADYSSDSGLQLGFRGELAWKSKLVLGGKLSGEFFKSNTMKSPPLVVYVPIGPVPVPVTLDAEAFVSCSAAWVNPLTLTLDIDLGAKIGTSLRVNPSTGTSAADWVKEGPWPSEASGHAIVTPSADADWATAMLNCALPRVELHAKVAGVAGPYLAITPLAQLTTDGGKFSVKVAAGASADLLGVGTGVEALLYTWEP
jgi:hypothetical protein